MIVRHGPNDGGTAAVRRRELRLRYAVQSGTRDSAVLDSALAGAEKDVADAAAADARSAVPTLLPHFVLQRGFGDLAYQRVELGLREADTRRAKAG
jgi:hypothetical protein